VLRKLLFLLAISTLTGCATNPFNLEWLDTEKGALVRLSEGILFDLDDATLKPEVFPTLDKIAEILNTRTNKNVSIEGHTDNWGEKNYNQLLSEKRATSVYYALVQRGVKPDRLSVTGYGMNNPLASNLNEAGRQQNRRVEIYVLGETKENLTGGEIEKTLKSFSDTFNAQ
jgi:OmpA-OmpF porin, OOP family